MSLTVRQFDWAVSLAGDWAEGNRYSVIQSLFEMEDNILLAAIVLQIYFNLSDGDKNLFYNMLAKEANDPS